MASWGVYEGTLAGQLAVQSAAGRRPTYNANDGGYPSLSSSNANRSSLDSAHSAAWLVTAFSWLAVVKTGVWQNYRHLWGRGPSWTNAGCYLRVVESTSTVPVLYWHCGYTYRAVFVHHPANDPTAWFVAAGTADTTVQKGYVNRQSASRLLETQTIAMGTSGTTLFSDADDMSYGSLDGALREIAFWNTALTESQMASEIDAAMSRGELRTR